MGSCLYAPPVPGAGPRPHAGQQVHRARTAIPPCGPRRALWAWVLCIAIPCLAEQHPPVPQATHVPVCVVTAVNATHRVSEWTHRDGRPILMSATQLLQPQMGSSDSEPIRTWVPRPLHLCRALPSIHEEECSSSQEQYRRVLGCSPAGPCPAPGDCCQQTHDLGDTNHVLGRALEGAQIHGRSDRMLDRMPEMGGYM